MVVKSDNHGRVHVRVHRGSLNGVRIVRAPFRGAIGVSLLMHAVAFASAWRVFGNRLPDSATTLQSDVWVGTTVSVIAEKAGHSEPSSPEETLETDGHGPQGPITPPAAARPATIQKLATREVAMARSEAAPQRPTQTVSRAPATLSRALQTTKAVPVDGSVPDSSTGSELKKAMLEASNQTNGGAGTFGAVGVDLRERRLPAAITRALPVAIGAQPGWWRGKLGPLGSLTFDVTLDEAGKIQTVAIDDESAHAWASRIVRRVERLLSVGRFALPATMPGARQRFELTLELEQRPASTSITAEGGDAVDMGWEAPTGSNPGKAHIQEAQGRRLRATLRALPAVKAGPSLKTKPQRSSEAMEPDQNKPE